MKVTLLSHTPNAVDLLLFTKATRLTMSPGLMEEIAAWSNEKKLQELDYMANTIPSSWEFVDYTFLIEGVSRAFTHQFVRSRHGSFAQQTLRMLSKADGYEYVPTRKNKLSDEAMRIIAWHTQVTLDCYNDLLEAGQAPEDARGVLPTNIGTNIVAKFNLRTLSEITKSRSGGRTQGEYQDVVREMANRVLEVHQWAAKFLFPAGRSYFDAIESFADDRLTGEDRAMLLKIVDKMRKDGAR